MLIDDGLETCMDTATKRERSPRGSGRNLEKSIRHVSLEALAIGIELEDFLVFGR
jgi:hypothetical protein